MILQNPVAGVIHPYQWSRPIGNRDFKVTQRFGCTGVKAEPPLGSCEHFHRGIDLGNKGCGAPVFAAGKGIVHLAKVVNAAGNLEVVINHGGGVFTTYGHLAAKSVAKGQSVTAGQRIGTLGNSGAVLCHLHFGYKTGASASLNIFSDSNGTWHDAWPQLAQNVTVRPSAQGVYIRNANGAKFAQTKATGKIVRLSDGAVLGDTATMRDWGGTITLAVPGIANTKWERMLLDGDYRLVAVNYAIKSAS